MAERGGFEPPVRFWRTHDFQSCRLSRSRTSPHHSLAEGRGFEPPRDLLGPYPISSRTPSTGLGHPSANLIVACCQRTGRAPGTSWMRYRERNDRAPSFERPVLRSPHGTCSSQVLPRHTRGSPYRCSLPGLAGFGDSRCVGPNLQRRPMRLIQHGPPSRGNSTPLKRIAGYRAPLTPRLARPIEIHGQPKVLMAERGGFEPPVRF